MMDINSSSHYYNILVCWSLLVLTIKSHHERNEGAEEKRYCWRSPNERPPRIFQFVLCERMCGLDDEVCFMILYTFHAHRFVLPNGFTCVWTVMNVDTIAIFFVNIAHLMMFCGVFYSPFREMGCSKAKAYRVAQEMVRCELICAVTGKSVTTSNDREGEHVVVSFIAFLVVIHESINR